MARAELISHLGQVMTDGAEIIQKHGNRLLGLSVIDDC
jgi:hypothetical protein